VPKKRTPPQVQNPKSKQEQQPPQLEDESLIARKIAPKSVLEKVDETNKIAQLEEDANSVRREKLKSEEKFNSGSFRNQFTTSFPTLYASSGNKKNKDSTRTTPSFRSKESISNILNPKMSLMDRYNLNQKLESSYKFTKLLDKRKKENGLLNSIDLKFSHLNDESMFFDTNSSDFYNSQNMVQPKSQSTDLLVLPNVVKSSDSNTFKKNMDYFHYGSFTKRKPENLIIT
jgi:hypothetical protein